MRVKVKYYVLFSLHFIKNFLKYISVAFYDYLRLGRADLHENATEPILLWEEHASHWAEDKILLQDELLSSAVLKKMCHYPPQTTFTTAISTPCANEAWGVNWVLLSANEGHYRRAERRNILIFLNECFGNLNMCTGLRCISCWSKSIITDESLISHPYGKSTLNYLAIFFKILQRLSSKLIIM